MMIGRPKLKLVTALLLGGLALAGCSQKSPEAPAVPLDAKRSFDLFLGDKLGLIDYAQQKVRNSCLAGAGYPQNQQTMMTQPRNPFAHLVITARTFGAATEEEARKFGLGKDLDGEPASVISYDSNYDKAFDDCTAKAWQQLGKDARDTYSSYFDLGNKLAGPLQPLMSKAISPELSRALHDCMTAKGYKAKDANLFLKAPLPDVYGIPLGSHASRGERWQPAEKKGTVQVSPPHPVREYIPTPQESAFAVAWFQCRQDAKLTQFQLDQAEKLQRELVTKFENVFAELNPKIEDTARKAAELAGQS